MSSGPSGSDTPEPGIFSEFAYKPTESAAKPALPAGAPAEAAMATSSDSEEDTAWFKKSTPANGAGAGAGAAARPVVKPAKAMASPGELALFMAAMYVV